MQKPVRPGVKTGKKRIFFEALNPHFGYFYTVNRTLCKGVTEFQQIELVETDEFGKVLLLDNITQIGERCEYSYHEPMVHPALSCHPKPESVLVIGGGDGGILREVLKYRTVRRVELAELDGEVIEFSKQYLPSVHQKAFDDPRVSVNITDGREFTRKHPREFDVIIMDMTDPFGPSKMLYSKEFFRIVRTSMRDDNGIFVMHSESPISRPSTFACINRTLRSVFTHVNQMYTYIQMYGVLWSFALASPAIDTVSVRSRTIDSRLKKNGIENLMVYNGRTHGAMQTPYPFITSLLRKPARIITDRNPDFPDEITSQ